MIKIVMSLAVSGVFLFVNAQTVLFSTDFVTKPAGIKELSSRATSNKADETIVAILPDGSSPKDTVIDGMTFTVGWENQSILISKASQKPSTGGDPGASNGRLSIKNSNCSVTLPTVPGPCTITYYASGSAAAIGKSIECWVNEKNVPEAGFEDLSLNGVQVTRKMTYTAAIGGDVTFKLVGRSGVYLYDIEIVTSDVASIRTSTVKGANHATLQITGNTIVNKNNDMIQILNPLGAVIVSSNNATINLQSLVKGTYVVRAQTSDERFTIVR